MRTAGDGMKLFGRQGEAVAASTGRFKGRDLRCNAKRQLCLQITAVRRHKSKARLHAKREHLQSKRSSLR